MRLSRYPEYKPSRIEWLPEVPSHWIVKRIRHAANLNPSKRETQHLPRDLQVDFLPMEAVGTDGRISRQKKKPIESVIDGFTYFREGDVALAKITPCFENGKCAVMRDLAEGVGFGTTELIVLRPKPDQAVSEYLFYLLSSEPFRVLGESEMYGAGGQKRVSDNFVQNFRIAFPPVPEQKEIAAFLDHEAARIDALIEEQQRLIELLKEKRQAVISHAVTKGLDPDAPIKDSGVEWLGEVPYHWSIARIKHITSSRGGGTPSKENPDYWDGAVPWVSPKDMKQSEISDSIDHVTDAAISETGLGMIEPKSVLIVVRGMILDHSIPVALTAAPVTINQDMKALTAGRSIEPNYLLILLTGLKQVLFEFVDSSAHGTKTFQWEMFQNLDVPLPSLQEQQRICREVASSNNLIDQLLEEANHLIQILTERRSALISAAVTGKIDVRNWQSETGAVEPLPMAAEKPATYEAREQ